LVISNIIVPGSGLLLRDRVLLGCALLLLTLLCLALLVAGPLLMSADFAAQSRWWILALYVGLAALSGLLWWRCEAATPLADSVLRERHRHIAKAWLNGQETEARAAAQALVRQARHLPVAWDLLALVGDQNQVAKARSRASHLRRRGQ